MSRTIRFLANDRMVETDRYGLSPALDFIRRDLGLTGTKEGCREGDCGACSVLVGERGGGTSNAGYANFTYRAQPSCIMALAELDGRHLVTIEGLASAGSPGSAGAFTRLTPVMRAILDENGSQCGFCSPGFVVALTAFLLSGPPYAEESAFAAIEGNLCRCTGYGALKRAALRLARDFADLPADPSARLAALVERGVVPPSLSAFASGTALAERGPEGSPARATGGPSARAAAPEAARPILQLGGGTDFLVRHPDPEAAEFGEEIALLSRDGSLRGIRLVDAGSDAAPGARLEIGAAVTWREFFSDPLVARTVPSIGAFESLVASPLVRERATVGGNVANASPVADLSSMLIALGAAVRLRGPAGGSARERELPLERLFLGYKKLDLGPGEIIAAFLVPASRPAALFNFEKASKRERLDIAAVNTAAAFEAGDGPDGKRITRARISAGGVAAVPLLLARTSAFLEGKEAGAQTAREAARIARSEVTPIGDVRGSAEYRSRVLGRLVVAHFVRLFPGSGCEEALR
jgi:xanthine dehydrogenase small subunit